MMVKIMWLSYFILANLLLNCNCSVFNILLNTVVKCSCTRRDDLDVSEIKVYVYNFETNSNATYAIDNAADAFLNRSDFNANQCIHIYVPGYQSFITDPRAETTRCIFSQIDCNGIKPLAIIFDHSNYTAAVNVFEEINVLYTYQKAVKYTKSIAYNIADFLIKILEKVNRKNINIVGLSLGAHMIGYVGDYVKNKTGTPLKSLYAADPARPCYDDCPNEHVKSRQADLVVAFHCNAGELGSTLNLADYDFYSNDGTHQATCKSSDSLNAIVGTNSSFCSHGRCLSIVENAAIHNSIWPAVKCSSAHAYLKGDCNNNESTLAGYTIVPNATRGVYYFKPSENLTCQID